jgi:hypothetical protein
MKNQFVKNELWTLTFAAAFQRANVYRDKVTEEEKQEFKTRTRAYIEDKLLSKYVSSQLSDDEHLASIKDLSDFTKAFSGILQGGQLNFGVSQKMLNLFLKYQWCINEITTPPHFPVDRRIQESLKIYPITSWTTYTNEKEYMNIIQAARKKAKPNQSIAELELEIFERRFKTTKE